MDQQTSDSYSFDQDDEGFVDIANELLTKFHLSPIEDLTQCTADVLVALYEGILGNRLTGAVQNPVSREDEIHNMQLVITSLEHDVLHVDLSHITGKDIVEGNLTTLRYLLEILAGLMEYVMEQIDSEGSTIDTEVDSLDVPDKLTLGTISSISHVLQDDLSSQSSHTRAKPWDTRAPATVSRPPDDDTSSNSTHDLIRLGESAASAYGYNGSMDTELEPAEHPSMASSNANKLSASWQLDQHYEGIDSHQGSRNEPYERMEPYYEETDPRPEGAEQHLERTDQHGRRIQQGTVYQAADTTEDLIKEGEMVAKENATKKPAIIQEEPERDKSAAGKETHDVVPGSQNISLSTASSASWPKPLRPAARVPSEFDSLGLGIRDRSVDKGLTMERLERALDGENDEITRPPSTDLHIHSNLHIHHHYQEPGLSKSDPVYASKLPSSEHLRGSQSAPLPDKSVQKDRPSSATYDNATPYYGDRHYTSDVLPDNVGRSRSDTTASNVSRGNRLYTASAIPDNDAQSRPGATNDNASINITSRQYKRVGIPNVELSSRAEYVPSVYANNPDEISSTSKDISQRLPNKEPPMPNKGKTLQNMHSKNNSGVTDEDKVTKVQPNAEVLRYQARALLRQRQSREVDERTSGFIPARDHPSSLASEKSQTYLESKQRGESSVEAHANRSAKLADLKSQSFPPYETIDTFLPSRSKHTSTGALPTRSTHGSRSIVGDRNSRSKHLSGGALPTRSAHESHHVASGRTTRSKHVSAGTLPARATHDSQRLVSDRISRLKHLSGGALSTKPKQGSQHLVEDHTSQDTSRFRQSNLSLESQSTRQSGQNVRFDREPERQGVGTRERQIPVPRITREIVPSDTDSDLEESAIFSDSQIDYSHEPTRQRVNDPKEGGYNLRSRGKRPLSKKPYDKRQSKRPVRKQQSVLLPPSTKPNLKVRFEDALDADAKGEIGKIRKKLNKEKKTQERQKQVLQTVYASNLKEVKNNLQQQAAKRKRKVNEEDDAYKAVYGKPQTSRYQPAKKYNAKVAAPDRASRAPVNKTGSSKRKRSASSSPVQRRSRRQLHIGDDEMLPTVMQEFPFLHVSPQTAHNMWSKQMRQMEQLTKAGLDLPSKSKAQLKMEEAERRQEILLNIMKKELAHNQRMREIKERRAAERVMVSKAREQKQVTARARRYYDDFRLRAQSRMMKKKNREEQIFKKLFENGLAIQKSRIHEMRKYAKEKRQQISSRQQDEIDSLENYYRDQFGMLAETIAKERHDLHVRDNAQNKVMEQMKRELRKKMEKDVKDFQEQLYRDEDSEYFRQIEADRMERQLQMAQYKM